MTPTTYSSCPHNCPGRLPHTHYSSVHTAEQTQEQKVARPAPTPPNCLACRQVFQSHHNTRRTPSPSMPERKDPKKLMNSFNLHTSGDTHLCTTYPRHIGEDRHSGEGCAQEHGVSERQGGAGSPGPQCGPSPTSPLQKGRSTWQSSLSQAFGPTAVGLPGREG